MCGYYGKKGGERLMIELWHGFSKLKPQMATLAVEVVITITVLTVHIPHTHPLTVSDLITLK